MPRCTLLFFAVPLAGWAYSSAAGFPVVLFGVLPLPDFVAPDRELSETLKPLHRVAGLRAGRRGRAARGRRAEAPLRRPRRPAAAHDAGAPPRHPDRSTDPPLSHVDPHPVCLTALAAGPRRRRRAGRPRPAPAGPAAGRRQRDRLHHAPDGRAGRGPVRQVQRPGGAGPEEARGRQRAPAPSTPPAPASAAPSSTPRCPSRPGWTRPSSRRPPSSPARIKAAGPGRFEVAGKLTHQGRQRATSWCRCSWRRPAPQHVASGSFTIKRLDFKVGEGEWADTSMLANDVLVRFKLVLAGLAPL